MTGQRHIGNMSDPRIPAALAPAIAGVIPLHDFKPHAMHKRANFTFISGGVANQALTPADLATIYNFSPLFAAGITGKGQTIAVIEDSDLYNDADGPCFALRSGWHRLPPDP